MNLESSLKRFFAVQNLTFVRCLSPSHVQPTVLPYCSHIIFASYQLCLLHVRFYMLFSWCTKKACLCVWSVCKKSINNIKESQNKVSYLLCGNIVKIWEKITRIGFLIVCCTASEKVIKTNQFLLVCHLQTPLPLKVY